MVSSISVDGKKVLLNGSLIIPPGKDSVELGIEDLKINFKFVDRSGDVPKVEQRAIQGKSAEILLVDWNNILGTAYLMPGAFTINNRKYDMNIYVHVVGDKPSTYRSFTYTVVES